MNHKLYSLAAAVVGLAAPFALGQAKVSLVHGPSKNMNGWVYSQYSINNLGPGGSDNGVVYTIQQTNVGSGNQYSTAQFVGNQNGQQINVTAVNGTMNGIAIGLGWTTAPTMSNLPSVTTDDSPHEPDYGQDYGEGVYQDYGSGGSGGGGGCGGGLGGEIRVVENGVPLILCNSRTVPANQ